jgi:lipopolysaccharide O-acetyltransferase
MKKLLKQLATFAWHPIVSFRLLVAGTRDFTIFPRMKANRLDKISVGNHFYLGHDSRFLIVTAYRGQTYAPGITIGNNVTIGNRFSALSAAPITIRDDCLLASDILITSENHGMDPENHASYADNPLTAAPVSIGKGCWIGEKVVILPGVSLGEKCIVAAGAVVNRSFPAYTLIGGIPARALKSYDFENHCWGRAKANNIE